MGSFGEAPDALPRRVTVNARRRATICIRGNLCVRRLLAFDEKSGVLIICNQTNVPLTTTHDTGRTIDW